MAFHPSYGDGNKMRGASTFLSMYLNIDFTLLCHGSDSYYEYKDIHLKFRITYMHGNTCSIAYHRGECNMSYCILYDSKLKIISPSSCGEILHSDWLTGEPLNPDNRTPTV